MFDISLKHTFATLAVAAGLLAPTASASAGNHPSGLVSYNGHAGLGASAYQHNQTELDARGAGVIDGTSNTITFKARAATPTANVDLAGPFVPNN